MATPPPPAYNDVFKNGQPSPESFSKEGYSIPPQNQNSISVNATYPETSDGLDNDGIDDTPEGFSVRGSFMDKDVRRLFIRKVFITLGIQLLVTFGFVCVFTLSNDVKSTVQTNPAIYWAAYIVFLVVYITIVCCKDVRRKHPLNIICLMIFTLAMSYMTGTIASMYDTTTVIYALGATTLVCAGVIVFSMQTRWDFTMYGGCLFVACWVLFLFGFVMIICWSAYGNTGTFKYLNVVWGALGALVFSLFLVYDTQMLMGGKKYTLDPEEYIYGALNLYIDVVYIFLYMLKVMRGGR